MLRATSLSQILSRPDPWDLAIIGGGATGIGIALDSASRGYSTCLLEQADFGKGTSSRSTKLVHGGVRYLQQGNIALVTEALHERGILRQNAPHLVHDLPFIVPNYHFWEAPFYGVGLKVYDLLAGQFGFGKSRHLSKEEVLAHIPTLQTAGLRGGILYFDGQFDDARLLIDLAHTATAHGAALLNYAPVTSLTRDPSGHLTGLTFQDADPLLFPVAPLLQTVSHTLRAKCIINAAGPFVDAIRTMDHPAAAPLIAPSQGVHIVLDKSFLPGDAAIMVPRTSDHRVLFAIPWLNHTLLGTTDTPIPPSPSPIPLEPSAKEEEITFLLQTAARYLQKAPTRTDILSHFTGIRPLVRRATAVPPGSSVAEARGSGVSPAVRSTAALSRDHHIDISPSGLLTITGGKWTTYRRMAQDAVTQAASHAHLPPRPCQTESLPISGTGVSPVVASSTTTPSNADLSPAARGTGLPPGELLHPALPITRTQILHALRNEMARTLEDILSRRTRCLLLNARATLTLAPTVAAIMAQELHQSPAWQQAQLATFTTLAQNYLLE